MKRRERLWYASLLALGLFLDFALPAIAFGGGTGGGSGFGRGSTGGGGGFSSGGGLGGGGFGFPLFFPFLGIGGGSIIPIVIFLAFLWLSRQSSGGGRSLLGAGEPSNVNLIQLEIGLLGTAKEVPPALHQLVASVDTSTNAGLSQLLQQAALLLLRNQQYWHAASYSYRKVPYRDAESSFNSLTLQARSKLEYETITNVDGIRREDPRSLAFPGGHPPASNLPPGDYIVVVLVVASSAPLHLQTAVTADAVRDQLAEIAAASGSNLQAVEVIWQPDNTTEALSRDDLVSWYPELAPI